MEESKKPEKSGHTPYLEIKGKKYRKRPKKSNKSNKSNSKLGVLVAISMGIYGATGSPSQTRKRPNVNLVEEFKLIQDKKSKLSSNDRDWVEAMFHKEYEEVQ